MFASLFAFILYVLTHLLGDTTAPQPPQLEPTIVSQPTPAATPDAVVSDEPTCPEGQEYQGEFGCVQPQLPEETIGRQYEPTCPEGQEYQGEFGCVQPQLPEETIGRQYD